MFVAEIGHYRHLVAIVMDSDRETPLFHSPIGDNPQHILDLGTGQGKWAMYVNKIPQDLFLSYPKYPA
jgi:ubiquinone/menaquinone biosynthesis C-methylase UbiE